MTRSGVADDKHSISMLNAPLPLPSATCSPRFDFFRPVQNGGVYEITGHDIKSVIIETRIRVKGRMKFTKLRNIRTYLRRLKDNRRLSFIIIPVPNGAFITIPKLQPRGMEDTGVVTYTVVLHNSTMLDICIVEKICEVKNELFYIVVRRYDINSN